MFRQKRTSSPVPKSLIEPIAFALLCLSTMTCAQPGPALTRHAVDTELRTVIAGGRNPLMRWPKLDDVAGEAAEFYGAHGGHPGWFEGSAPTEAGLAMVRELVRADDYGLDPADYDGQLLSTATGSREVRSPGEIAKTDLAITCDALRYMRALHRGRIGARQAHATLDLPRAPFAAVAILDSLLRGGDPAAIARSIQPPYENYWRLIDAHRRYRELATDTTLLPLPPPTLPLRSGDAYSGAGPLRRLLAALGDLPDEAAVVREADDRYDTTLVVAIQRFQRRQGFTADGVVGTKTLERLDRPFAARVRQIELSLERWRWLPATLSGPQIFVNLPAFRLVALDSPHDSGAVILNMDVQAGSAFKHETPVFAALLRYLVFSPYWEVPTSIMRAEIKPKALKDPKYLTRNHYQLLEGYGDRAPVVEASAGNVARIGGAVRVRQTPGVWNSLGRVKFMLPNPYNIYLHDTPSQANFAKARRDFSHGCIRLAQPQALAEHVLRDQAAWTGDRIARAMAGTVPEQVNLLSAIPVYIVYATAAAQRDDRVLFYDDIYGHDRRLEAMLRLGYPYPR